jgi:hypothetical protein
MSEYRQAQYGDDAPGTMAFTEPVSWFVYNGRGGSRTWQWVYHCKAALTGEEAIREAIREAVEMGNTPAGNYMAAPTPALVTVSLDDPAEQEKHDA